ncbi:hypothetical protein OG897_29495 [Streptomyces sp. NBC_00237]|uniref:hypothetical protein n=1 Tax=Streptomyces sp. NBC_00237 TaxID=2975687 RepID=UPI002259ABA7|nr:hypothetical protein [Streptomyces sp. NBC_00237]MCX5205582.1 hypothetical protein [Streptomyces sp. NBC_00237]
MSRSIGISGLVDGGLVCRASFGSTREGTRACHSWSYDLVEVLCDELVSPLGPRHLEARSVRARAESLRSPAIF